MRRPTTLLLGSLLATTLGCGTMTVTAADPQARLYAGGRMLGKGHGEIKRRGTPESTIITAVSADGRRTQAVAKREFTGFTFLTGLFTYGICLFACWEYPSAVYIPMPVPAAGSGFDGPAGAAGASAGAGAAYGAPQAEDPWLKPPAGWQPRAQ